MSDYEKKSTEELLGLYKANKRTADFENTLQMAYKVLTKD